MDIPNLDMKEIAKYLEITGKKGGMVLSILGRLHNYLEAVLRSDVGKEILSEDLIPIESLLVKIYHEEATPLELAEFRYLRDIRLPSVIGKLKKHVELLEGVKKDVIKAS